MTFFQHTANWIRGEIFEGQMLALWGFMLIAMGVFFWRLGFSPATRALIVPFVLVGALWGTAGFCSMVNNKHRMEAFQEIHNANPIAFVLKEKERVEDFSKWYRYLLGTWSVLIFSGVLVFMLIGGNNWRAAGVGLILFGISGLLVDHTSEQNARVYESQIQSEIARPGA